MSSWDLVQEVFAGALKLGSEERERYVRKRLKGREAQIEEVLSLLRADSDGTSALERPAFDHLKGTSAEEAPLLGLEVGPYRLESFLSSGGMGHVYRATHSRGDLERSVAFKVLRRGLDTDALLARFHREQRTLAALDHEGIVRFLDAGALPDGRPFLVMELVDGEPITEWCAARELPWRERATLFLEVLSAVQHAHEKLIVHRDLKPSHVLVTSAGRTKLLDFGVATLLRSDDGSAGTTRIGGGIPLTPRYASPEQRRGEPVTTASDVYSLGVIFEELIEGDEGARVADLRRIVAKARHEEPTRRYPTVQSLVRDVRLCLEGRPIEARPDSLGYRAMLFLRRNVWQSVSAAALLLALITGLVGAEIGRQRALSEASRGWGAHLQAKSASRYLEDLLAEVTAEGADWETILIRREESLDRQFDEHPETEGLVRLAFARLWIERGRPERARPHLGRIAELTAPGAGLSPAEARRAEELIARGKL
ncbi:MAG: protein kinase [Planctomycetota bacterium]